MKNTESSIHTTSKYERRPPRARATKRITVALVAVLFPVILSFPGSAHAEATVNEMLKLYDESAPATQQYMEMRLSDIQNGVSWANTLLIVAGKQPFYCTPQKMALTGNQILDILRRMAKDPIAPEAAPTIGEKPFGLAMIFALQQTFPCATQK